MNKKARYISGAVAVALLTAGSPIIAPMLNPVNVVKAATDLTKGHNVTNESLSPSDMLTAFKSQFDNRYVASSQSITSVLNSLAEDSENNFNYFDLNNPKYIHDFQNSGHIAMLKDTSKTPIPSSYFYSGSNNNYYYRDMLVAMTIADKDGNNIDISDTDKLKNLTMNDSEFPLTATIHISESKDTDLAPLTSLATVTDPSLLEFSFKISLSRFDISKNQSMIPITVGSSLSSLSTEGNGLKITDNYTNDPKYTSSLTSAEKPMLGQSLFTSREKAAEYAAESDFDPTITDKGDASPDQFSDGKINSNGTYYQTVSYNLSGADSAIEDMLTGDKSDVTGAAVSPYQTFINGSNAAATPGTDYVLNRDTKTITVIRKLSTNATINAKLSIPQVKVNSLISDAKPTAADYLSDQSGENAANDIPTSNVEVGSEYYTDPSLGPNYKATSDEVSATNFLKPGKYYRTIKFTLKNGSISDYDALPLSIDSDSKGNTVTYVQEVDVRNDATANYDNPLDAKIGDTSNTVSKNDTLISTDSSTGLSTNLVQDNGISFGNKYYQYTPGQESTLQDDILNNSSSLSATNGVVDSSGKFAISGDYLRTITYTLVANSVDTNTFDTTNSKYKLGTDSKGNDTITYVQKVHVSQIPVIVSIKDLTVNLGAKNQSDQMELTREKLAENDITTDGSSSSSLLDPSKDSDDGVVTGMSFGDEYYTDPSLGEEFKSSTGLSSAKTYYRKITFYLTADIKTLSFGDTIPWAKDEDKNSVTFVQKIRVLTNEVKASVPDFTSQIGINVMPPIVGTDNQVIVREADANLSLTTDSVSIADVENSDNKFYSSKDNAQKGINAITFNQFNNVFTIPGTYYRKVIFHLGAGTDVKNYIFPQINDLDPVSSTADDGRIPTVEYLQKIVINSPELIAQTDHYASDIVTIGEDMSKVMDDSILTSLNANGNVIVNGTVGTEYFDDASHAIRNEDPVSGTTFTEAKPYYRRVIFKLPGDISKYTSFSGEEGVDYTIDKSNNTITYAQKINVIDPRVTVTIPDISIDVNAPVSKIDDKTDGISFIANETGKSIASQDKIFVYSHMDPTSDSEPDYYFKDSSLTDIIKDIQNQNWMFKDGNRVFTAPGTYYRLIMFTAENLPDYYTFGDTNNGSTEKSDNTTVGYYIQRVNVGYPVTAKIDPGSSKVGSDITSVDAGNNDLISSEESGKSIVDTSATSYGTEYYNISDDEKDILDKKVKPISDVTDGEKFTKSGTYYRVVKFVLKSDENPSNYSFGNGKLSSDGKSVEYVQKVNIATGEVRAAIDQGEIKFGETLPSNSLGVKVDLVLSDGGGSIMSDGKITYGNKYYKSIDDAMKGKDPLDTVSNAADPYYRTVTFTLKNPVDSYTFSGDHLIDKDNNTVTFAQEIKVEPANAVFSVKPLDGVEAKTSTTDQRVTQTDSYTLVGSTSVKVGDIYYKNRDGALEDALNPGKDESLIATDATSGNYLNEGNWYRLIYFTVDDNFFNNYEVSDDNMEKVDNHTVVYAQPVNVSHSTAVTNPEITDGTAVVDNSINTVQSGVNKLLDSNNKVISENPSFGSDYYDKYDYVFDTDATKSTDVVDGVFKKAKTYYRKITFTLTDDAIAANNFDANAHVSGNTVSYVQTVNVSDKTNINIDADSTVNVTAGSAEGTLTNDYKLTDDNNNTVGTLSTSDKITYYGELTDALAQNTKTDSDAISGGNFNAGKYYRLLVFTPNAGVNKDNYSLNNPNLAWSADGTKILFAQEIDASANAVSKYNISTSKVTVGSSEKDSETSKGNQIFDHSGKEISASVTFGKDYYANSGDVFDTNVKPVDGVVVDGNFVKVDTYYREIIFHLSHADIVNNSFGTNAKVNTTENTVSYVQTVVVSQVDVARINVNPISVNVGTSVDSVKNTDTLTDVTNKSLGTATVDNSKFYDKATDALSGDNVDTNATTNGLFNKGTYYRLVTFKTVSDFAKNYTLNDPNAKTNADGSVTYAQKIDVKANGVVKHNFGDISANIGELTDKIAAATGTLTDTSGNKIKASVSAESIYYDNYDDVFSGTGKVTEGINADKQFTRAGAYYRKISFKLDGSVDIKNYDFGSDAHVSGNIVSFVQTVVVGENAASITVGPLNIKTGTRTNDQSVTSTDGYVLKAGNDSFTNPTLGMTYYKSINGALGKSNGDEVDPNAVTAVTDGAFNKGTYYRQVVFKVGNDFVDKYNWTDSTDAIYKDGTVIYAQQINVKDSVVSKHTIEDAKANVGDSVTSVTSTGNALMDASGNKLDATVSYGTDYYDNYDDVFTPNAAKTKDIANGAFTKAGTYYRVISFTVSPEAIAQNDFGSEAHISGNTVSFVQAVSVDTKATLAVNINVTPTITVNAGTATDDAKLMAITGYTLSNKLGTILATVSAGSKYYTDAQSALKQGDTGLADVNGQFTKADTYYRVITFKPSKAIDADSISNPNARVNADGTISYVQAVTVTKNDANINSSVGELDLRANAEKDNPALINTKEYFLTDAAGNSLVDKTKGKYGVELGQIFYTDSSLKQKTADASGARISKSGTYYRTVKFYLTNGAADANKFERIGGTYDATDNSVTFVQMVKASATPVSPSNPAIAKINNVTVDNGTSMTDKALQNTDDVYIVDKNGDSIIADGGIKFDTAIYDSVGRPVTNLNEAGTYNQVITVKLANDVSAYTFGAGYRVDTTNNTVSHVRTITVKAASSTGGNSGNTGGSTGGNSGSSTGTGTSTGGETDEDDDWNYSPIQGVVTTKTDHPFYTLNNQDNDKIPNRVLGQDSSWKTDQIRVNKDGVTQYRVGAGEWISADDVVLNQNSSEDGDWTYTPVQGVVTTKTDQKKYQLNNHENTAIANRDLKEDSSWKTDLYRTNKEGVRQYRVATGEWIDADDVNFNQDKEDFWTYETVSGVVKTKDGQTEYQLNDQENKAIAHRDLKEDSSWKTDLYRTNEAGVRQYRVATGEWIDAGDVDFINNKDDEGWIYTSISGIVTTKSNQANYQLDNQNNSAVAGRELVKDSSWKTDQYRTNREGVKQYRVATGEWVDANDVVYEDAVDTGIFRDGRKVSGIINLDRTNIFYDLYSRENEIIEDYSLGEETSWKTDYKAQDVNGDTYYHVGDNEWIKAEKGVHFNNYAWY